ncbi:zincin-like metallopeptidase domain-containing protein [uncultured Tenacibaculum sp.]|uniref:zincin-like metallopeptidase domain-containing protein n=1 Tax=uncultured Tenacibaculum sp. TaxID=174713 RepID=UPI0026215DC8|nr:zincin-like metallopeptidase domain-containing protein [uncultured Tenacibaculum sp.]
MLKNFIETYNNLDQTIVDRAVLSDIKSKSEILSNIHPKINEIYIKTSQLLKNSDAEDFRIEIQNKVSFDDIVLSNSEIKGLGVPFHDKPIDNVLGLNGKVSSNDIYQMITDKMIKLIEEATGLGYKKMWHADGFMYPKNFVSKKAYRGINHNLLTLFGTRNFKNPYFLTFKQIEKLKGKLKKGAKGYEVVYYSIIYTFSQKEDDLKISTYDNKKFISYLKKNQSKINYLKKEGNTIEKLIYKSSFRLLKYYYVFNGEDITGIDFKLKEYRKEMFKDDSEKLDTAERIIENYPEFAPRLKHGGDRAFYSPSQDLVQMPRIKDFETELDYYRTLFHEYVHSTGHYNRLDRLTYSGFGTPGYAKEELVAEFGSVFLSAEAGIMWRNNSNHAEYLKNWKNALQFIKEDNKLILRASTTAQKAVDYILQRDAEGTPLYLKKLEKEIATAKEIKTYELVGMNGSNEVEVSFNKNTFTSETNKSTTTVDNIENSIKESFSDNKQESNQAINPVVKEKDNTVTTNKQVYSVPKTTKNIEHQEHKNNRSRTLTEREAKRNRVKEYYKIPNPEIAEFLGDIEKKTKESVAITLAGAQGSGKTRFLFQLMETFAENYKVGHASMEEHPDSALYLSKEDEYISDHSYCNISNPEIETKAQLDKLIKENDVILIDSFAKLRKIDKNIQLDEDLRKKYDGKLFIVIYQLTGNGKMRGGSESQFDGDVILFVEKNPDYRLSYVYADKNRYQNRPLNELEFNIYRGELNNKQEKPIEAKEVCFIAN